MDKEKYLKIKYYRDVWRTQNAINSPSFQKLEEISDELFEVSTCKSSLRLDLPIQIGFQILQLAKLRMLEFYYDCLETLCHRSRFDMIEMDTDSAYFAIGGTFLDDHGLPQPATRLHHIAKDPRSFEMLTAGFCNDDPPYSPDDGHFFPRTCCPKHSAFDERTPALFKKEAEGDIMIALCPKMYILRSEKDTKVRSKGLQRGALSEPVRVFREVLATGVPASGTNLGIRARGGTMYTYSQERAAVSSFYCKRQVMKDGTRSRPLPTVLCP